MLRGNGFRLAALIALSLLAESVLAQTAARPARDDRDRYSVTLPSISDGAGKKGRPAPAEPEQPATFPPYPATQPPPPAPEQPPAAAPQAPGVPSPEELEGLFPAPFPEIRLFGHDFFDRVTEGFQPIPNLPPPAEYPLGPGDIVEVVLSSPAGQETVLKETVDSEGRLRIPNVGFVRVSGLTIAAAGRVIARETRSKFPSLSAQARILSIRPIQVFVIGEVKKPGAYILPGLSTLLNALYVAGGPTDAGSLRKISVQRNRKTIATVDLYRLLLEGDRSGDITLQSGDSVFVPAIGPTVTVKGEVRRQAIFELLGETSVRTVMGMAGGPGGQASLSSVRVERVVGGSRKVLLDLTLASPDSPDWEFPLQHGDLLLVQPVLQDAVNRVEISGPVRRPGEYELSEGMRLSDLVRRAEGFADEEIYLERATILRTRDDGSTQMLSVHLGRAMAGDAEQDVQLRPKDRVVVYSMQEAAALDRTVTIAGQVSRPGIYDRVDGMRLRDLIIAAGGARPEAHRVVEVARQAEGGRQTQILNVNLDRAMEGEESDNILLADGDQVSVKEVSDARRTARLVTITGRVRYPGTYALLQEGERVSSLVARAGGLTEEAFPEGAVFVRKTPALLSERQLEVAAEIQRAQKDLAAQIRELEMAKYGIAPKPVSPNAVPAVPSSADARAAEVSAAAAGLNRLAAEATRMGPLPAGEVSLEQARTVESVVASMRLPIDLPKGLEAPGSPEDLPLEDGDTLYIPRRPLVVSVAGAVVSPSVVVFREGMTAEDYIRQVGGYARDADRKNTVIVRAGGEIRRVKDAGDVRLGDIIIVPPRALSAPRSGWETISDVTRILGNLALTFLAVTD
jgi:polysaccharide export outer membrane protein